MAIDRLGFKAADTKRIRKCAPMLPPPGGEVVCELSYEIDSLRAELAEVRQSMEDWRKAHDVMVEVNNKERARLQAELANTRASYEGQRANTEAFYDDCERLTKERDSFAGMWAAAAKARDAARAALDGLINGRCDEHANHCCVGWCAKCQIEVEALDAARRCTGK